jgi:predicted nucleic acid-binding Zn ribbon protein
VSRLVHDEGWVQPLRDHAVVARWAEAVGAAVAEHAEAVSFEDGCLVVRCRSTAWAVQLRHLRGHVLDRLAAVHGAGVVTRLEVVGPHGPSWRAGRLRVPGRGPRDTYG